MAENRRDPAMTVDEESVSETCSNRGYRGEVTIDGSFDGYTARRG
jgi:hypothetical protein